MYEGVLAIAGHHTVTKDFRKQAGGSGSTHAQHCTDVYMYIPLSRVWGEVIGTQPPGDWQTSTDAVCGLVWKKDCSISSSIAVEVAICMLYPALLHELAKALSHRDFAAQSNPHGKFHWSSFLGASPCHKLMTPTRSILRAGECCPALAGITRGGNEIYKTKQQRLLLCTRLVEQLPTGLWY